MAAAILRGGALNHTHFHAPGIAQPSLCLRHLTGTFSDVADLMLPGDGEALARMGAGVEGVGWVRHFCAV